MSRRFHQRGNVPGAFGKAQKKPLPLVEKKPVTVQKKIVSFSAEQVSFLSRNLHLSQATALELQKPLREISPQAIEEVSEKIYFERDRLRGIGRSNSDFYWQLVEIDQSLRTEWRRRYSRND